MDEKHKMGPIVLLLFLQVALNCDASPAGLSLQSVGVQTSSGIALPTMHYRYTSFATSDPVAAAVFCEKYFGAVRIQKSSFLTHKDISANATIVGLRFYYDGRSSWHDVYFVHDSSKPSGRMTPDQYLDRLHKTHHFEIEETWDWYQDWHLCLHVQDVDLVAYRLLLDNVPIVTRSTYSIYVEIPFGITFQFLGTKMNVVWSEVFNFCRYTDGTGALQPLQIADIPKNLPALPELPAAHHSFFSNHPTKAFDFTLNHTSGVPYDMDKVWNGSHRYGDGRCALLRWIEFPGFEIHFVDQYRKFEGELKTADVEAFLVDLHGNMSIQDAFFDFRIGFEVDTLVPFQLSLKQAGQPFLMSGPDSMFIQIPGGIIFELLQRSSSSILI